MFLYEKGLIKTFDKNWEIYLLMVMRVISNNAALIVELGR